MAKAGRFYSTEAWQQCRNAYMKSVSGLCERCLQRGILEPAVIVHHKVHLDEDKAADPNIALNFDNLEALCRGCHADAHPEIYGKQRHRYQADELGRVKCIAPR